MSDLTPSVQRLVDAVPAYLIADKALHGIFSCSDDPCRDPRHRIIVESYRRTWEELYNSMEAVAKGGA